MRTALVIVFEKDRYNTMFKALFHDLRSNPDVYFLTEKSYPTSTVYRLLSFKRVKRLTSGVRNLLYYKLFYTYYDLPRLVFRLNREYDHVSVLFHNASLRKPQYPLFYFKMLRKKASLNLLYLDLHAHLYACQEANYLSEQRVFDKVFTIDVNDAQKYKLNLCSTPYSKIPLPKPAEQTTQLYYCGTNDGRLYTLYSIWKEAKQHGVSLEYDLAYSYDFQEFFEADPGVHFVDHISYEEVLEKAQSSSCILDITKKNQAALTLRPYEAVVYNRKLLSNNEKIREFKYYDERYMKVFQKVSDIDWDWLKEDIEVDYHYQGDYSPEKFIKELE